MPTVNLTLDNIRLLNFVLAQTFVAASRGTYRILPDEMGAYLDLLGKVSLMREMAEVAAMVPNLPDWWKVTLDAANVEMDGNMQAQRYTRTYERRDGVVATAPCAPDGGMLAETINALLKYDQENPLETAPTPEA